MKRRQARLVALVVLYQWDLTGRDPEAVLAGTLSEAGLEDDAARFAGELVRGAAARMAAIDGHIDRLAVDWRIDRMAAVDRNILRLAAHELMDRFDVPVSVIINEAVEMAKTFSTPEAARFINGILGRLAREVRDPAARV